MDETAVETVNTFNPSTQQLDTYSYPRPGTVNEYIDTYMYTNIIINML